MNILWKIRFRALTIPYNWSKSISWKNETKAIGQIILLHFDYQWLSPNFTPNDKEALTFHWKCIKLSRLISMKTSKCCIYLPHEENTPDARVINQNLQVDFLIMFWLHESICSKICLYCHIFYNLWESFWRDSSRGMNHQSNSVDFTSCESISIIIMFRLR